MSTVIVFVIILSLLIFVHELGHFITAKKAGIVVEEFGIGYPPRAVKLWQDEGKITLDGRVLLIGRKTRLPQTLKTGDYVYIETQSRPDGQTEVVAITPAKPDEAAGQVAPSALRVDGLEKPTEYTLNWIPFGGFVKMLGEEDPSAPGSFASKSKRARLIVLSAGAIMNLITAVVVFTIMFMTGQPEPIGPTYIIQVSLNSPASQAGIKPYDQVLKADDTVIESSQDLVEYTQQHLGQEITLTLRRGETELQVNLVPRKNPPAGEGAMGLALQTQYTQLKVTTVNPDSPAQKAGLQPGDAIQKVDGNLISGPGLLVQYLQTLPPQQAVTLSVTREKQALKITVQPEQTSPVELSDEQLSLVSMAVPALGAELNAEFLEQRITRLPLGEALLRGANATTNIVIQTFTIPVAIFKKLIPAEQARPVGPIGIYKITDSAVTVSRESNVIYPILFLTAILSAALAVTNLLPLPALDGGRILFILIEAIRGKRIPPEREGAIHLIGLALLLALMVVISYYDLTNPVDTSGLFK